MRLVIRIAALAAALAAVPATAQNAPLDLHAGETLLEVNATGSVPSRPDLMSFEAGVVSTGRTAREATDANAALAQWLIEALRAAGIAPVLRVSERSARIDSEGFVVVSGSRTMGTPIEPGEVRTDVQVWVDYALAPR